MTPAKYEWKPVRVMVQPERKKVVRQPAVMKNVRVRELVSPASSKTVTVPAEYKLERQKVMVQPERRGWKQVCY